MFGFRPEGRRIHDVDPIVAITPYLMPQRCDARTMNPSCATSPKKPGKGIRSPLWSC